MPIQINSDNLSSVLPPAGLTLYSGCSAESQVLADAVETAGGALGNMTFCGIAVGGLNRRAWRAGNDSRILTFFQTPELRAEGRRVEFLALCYQDALAELRRRKPTAALFMCAPPDSAGWCSFGTEVSFIAELWREIPVRVAHINPAMPCTAGDPGIPFAQLSAWISKEQPLLAITEVAPNPIANEVARHVAAFVHDGDTLQTGLGKLPDAIARRLKDRKRLRVHSGLLGDGLMDLIASGAVDHAIVGTAIGTASLYSRLNHPALEFRPVSITHGPRELAAIDRLVTINSAFEIDLFGQAYSEQTSHGLMSGPGGASDYTRGARPGGGPRILALPATAHTRSRIILPGHGHGPLSLSRFDTDVVVTEYGAADLRGLAHQARASALIEIASPAHRGELRAGWAAIAEEF